MNERARARERRAASGERQQTWNVEMTYEKVLDFYGIAYATIS